MNWQELGRKLAGLGLPALGGAVGGPLGAMTGRVVAEAIGAPVASPEAISAALDADPDTAVKLRRIEADMAAREMDHVEAVATIAAEDRQDARTYRELDHTRARLVWTLLVAVPAMAFGVALMSRYLEPGEAIIAACVTLLGVFSRELSGALQYYFGTSSGSTTKDRRQGGGLE